MPRKSGNHGFKRRINIKIWLMRHVQVLLASLGRMSRNPLGNLMTAAVIGIAISLPVTLYVLVGNLQDLGQNWDGGAGISVFLNQEATEAEAMALSRRLQQQASVASVSYISPQQAMVEFRQLSGFGDALDLLQENPLPAVLLIHPHAGNDNAEATASLAQQIQQLPEVELAQADLQWLQRFHAITHTLQRAVAVLASLLAMAVLLIVGNTIRLEIQGRRREIEIIKLVGGTNSFIRRPFLYDGIWYGLLGGIIASLLVFLAFSLLQGPVAKLTGLYQSNFQLAGLSFDSFILVLAGSTMLGLIGSWLAVKQHLDNITPA
jgi:cell division transport system permease protein